jgi:hypothetical protein
MKPICTTLRFTCAALALAALFLTTRIDASSGDSYQSSSPARVIAHLRISDSGARRMFLRQEGKTRYLYVQRLSQRGFTVIDVTNPGRPRVVKPLPLETRTVVGSGLMITETPDNRAAADTFPEEDIRKDGSVPEALNVLDINNPAGARGVPTFDGVASLLQDDARNLIYVVKSDRVWILSRPQAQREHRCGSSDAICNMPNCD